MKERTKGGEVWAEGRSKGQREGGSRGMGSCCIWTAGLEGEGSSEADFRNIREFCILFPTARKWGREAAESPSGSFGRLFQMF